MVLSSYALVLASAASHAYWNFLLKRSGGGQTFVGLSKLVEVALLAPIFLLHVVPTGLDYLRAWPLVVGGALLTLSAYVALARAYQAGDMSLVYPVSRGGTLLLLPIFGFVAFDERVADVGWLAVGLIVGGMALLELPALTARAAMGLWRRLARPSIGYAFLAAIAAAGYSIWDKHAVQTVPPFVYFYSYSVLIAVAYGVYLLTMRSAEEVRRTWSAHRWPVVKVAVANPVGYVLVLIALRSSTSTYVIAARQLSVAIGALLAWRLLGEHLAAPRRIGIALILVGCLIIAAAG